ncbi:MAG: hypothetical protein H0V43_04860 [Gemmatimonadales bacterium]|nr:hypothetical protein [Gemmatimonadales bacterium]
MFGCCRLPGGTDDHHDRWARAQGTRWVNSNQAEVTLLMDRPPVTAGFDPLNKLVDRRPDDNVVRAVPQD